MATLIVRGIIELSFPNLKALKGALTRRSVSGRPASDATGISINDNSSRSFPRGSLGQCHQFSPILDIPDLDRPVPASRGQTAPVGGEGDGERPVGVAFEGG